MSCEIACSLQHSSSKDLFFSIHEEPKPRSRVHVENSSAGVLPLQCRYCEEPYCIDACISGAITRDEETGLINVDEEKCVGCWMCVMVCPFGVLRPSPDGKVALRCDLCRDEEEPACVKACPTKALFFGEVEDFKKVVTKRAGE